jgi:hypothetical protein
LLSGSWQHGRRWKWLFAFGLLGDRLFGDRLFCIERTRLSAVRWWCWELQVDRITDSIRGSDRVRTLIAVVIALGSAGEGVRALGIFRGRIRHRRRRGALENRSGLFGFRFWLRLRWRCRLGDHGSGCGACSGRCSSLLEDISSAFAGGIALIGHGRHLRRFVRWVSQSWRTPGR